jgi:hypothetical protein
MLNLDLAHTICTIKDTLLSRDCSDRSKGLVVSTDISMGDSKRASVHFVFAGNTSVWFAVSKSLQRWDDIPIEEWENTSNHDSCWRNDGVRSPLVHLYFDWAREINPDKAPKDIRQFCVLGILSSSPWERVRVEYRKRPGADYRFDIISIQREER